MSTKGKAVLGRGLNALLPDADQQAMADGRVGRLHPFDDTVRAVGRIAEIDIARIRPNPFQPRRDFEEGALNELASSISQLGVIQPLTVRVAENGRYELISGERRLRAAKIAGLRAVPAYIRDADMEAMLEMAIVENVQREQLNPIEVALGYQRLIEECTLTQEQVADRVGKNRATVANTLRLLKLPPQVQAGLRDGRINAGHARALIPLDDADELNRLTEEIEARQLSVREVEERVRAWQQQKVAKEKPTEPRTENVLPDRTTLQLRTWSDELRSRLGTQIQIRYKPNTGGRIEIAYYSDEDLERVMEMLLG